MDQQQEWQKQWEPINRMGQEWYNTPAEGNEAYRHALWYKIFIALDRRYKSDVQKEALMDIMCNEWKKFDPAKGNVAQFISQRLRHRVKDITNSDIITQQVDDVDDANEKSQESGKKKKRKKKQPILSTDATIKDGDQNPNTAVDPAPPLEEQIENLMEKTFYILLSAILNLHTHLPKKENNPQKRNYYRLFFTDGISWFIENEKDVSALQKYERDIFCAIKPEFLDYFMSHRCRTVDEISTCRRKITRKKDGKEEECPSFLPFKIYEDYLLQVEGYQVGSSALSPQRTKYTEFLKNILGQSLC